MTTTKISEELEFLAYDVESTAEWRRRKAEEYPEDSRNKTAVDLLEKLAGDIPNLEGTYLHQRLKKLLKELPEDSSDYRESVNEELRTVGFIWYPESADALLDSIVNDVEFKLGLRE